MMRFHFMNNEELDNQITAICKEYHCDNISKLLNKVLFSKKNEILIFINYYCNSRINFKTVKGCRVNRKISIPDVVYHSLKLCHKELNTYSIALIMRSLLIEIAECFATGGLKAWEDFKKLVVEIGQIKESRIKKDNQILLRNINSVHIPSISPKHISKIGFYTFGNEFIGYIRC